MSFSWDDLASKGIALHRIYQSAFDMGEPGGVIPEYRDRFMQHINDDLNMPRGLAVAWDLIKSNHNPADKKATLLEFDEIFGLDIANWEPEDDEIPEHVLNLAQARETARKENKWQRADEIREEVLAAGYVIEDTRDGPRLKKS